MSKFDIDADAVHKMADLLKETGLHEIEYAEGDKRLRCVAAHAPVSHPPHVIPMAAPTVAHTEVQGTQKPVLNGTPVDAPMVGTVYMAPEPGAPHFVNVGDKVKPGDTLLIIEAMKVMNPIKAPVAGTITEIFVNDAKPVEFGETLLLIA